MNIKNTIKSVANARRDLSAKASLKTFETLRAMGVGPLKSAFASGFVAGAVHELPYTVIVGAARLLGGKKAAAATVIASRAVEAALVKVYGIGEVHAVDGLGAIHRVSSNQSVAEKSGQSYTGTAWDLLDEEFAVSGEVVPQA